MSLTVVGFFDDRSEAERAIEKLQGIGISRGHIDISRGQSATGSTRSSATGSADVNPVSGSSRDENSVRRTSEDRTVDREGRNTNVFTDFFNNLFDSNDNDEAGRYSHVAQRSGAVVTVHAQSKEEAEQASEVLDDSGAIDVNEKASQYGYMGTGSARGSDAGSGRLTSQTDNSRTGNENTRWRSRIFEKRLDDDRRWRSNDNDPII